MANVVLGSCVCKGVASYEFPLFCTYRVRERIKGRGASISRQIYKQKTVKKLPRCAENSLVWNIKKYWKVSMTFTCRVEWFSNFFDFWKPTHFWWSGIFLGTQLKKICNFGCAAKFLFSENHRDLKIFLLLKICRNLSNMYIKEQTTKKNCKKIC